MDLFQRITGSLEDLRSQDFSIYDAAFHHLGFIDLPLPLLRRAALVYIASRDALGFTWSPGRHSLQLTWVYDIAMLAVARESYKEGWRAIVLMGNVLLIDIGRGNFGEFTAPTA
jgi:hypothetical protein